MAQVRRGGIRWLLGCLAVLLCACPGWAQVKLILDGRPVAAGDALLLIGTGLGLSASVMTQELGIEVDGSAWPVVQLRAGAREARLEAGQRTAVIDGRTVQLQAIPELRDGMLYVPLHLVAELAGLRVEYDLAAGVLHLERRATVATGVAAATGRSAVTGSPFGEDGASRWQAAVGSGPAPQAPSVASPVAVSSSPAGGSQRTGAAPGPPSSPLATSPATTPTEIDSRAGFYVAVEQRAVLGLGPAERAAAPGLDESAPSSGQSGELRTDAPQTAGAPAALRHPAAPEQPVAIPSYTPPARPSGDIVTPGVSTRDADPQRPARPQPRPEPQPPLELQPAPEPEPLQGPQRSAAPNQPAAEPRRPTGPEYLRTEPELPLALALHLAELQRRVEGLAPDPAPPATTPPDEPGFAPAQVAAAPEPQPSVMEPAPVPGASMAIEPVGQEPVTEEPAQPRAAAETEQEDKPESAEAPAPSPAPPLPSFPFSNAGRVLLPAGEATGALLDVRVRTVDGRQELVAITDGPVEVRAVYLPEPDRLVVDLPGATLATDWRVMPMDGVVMHQLRVSGEQGGVRLVADLTAPTGYTLLPAEEHPGFVVRLNHQLREVSAAPAEEGLMALEAAVSGGPILYQAFVLREPWRVVVDLFDVTVSAPLDLQLDQGGVKAVRVSQFRQDAARIVLELQEPVEWPASPMSGQAHPGPDGRLAILLDADGRLVFNPHEPSPATNLLEFVGFVRENGTELVLLQGRGPLDGQVRRFREPERIVLDLPGVLLERTLGPLTPPGSAVVAAVRAGQADPSTGRVVVETREVAEHQVFFSPDRTRAVLSVRPSHLAGRVVVVDAGHGGRDPGAMGPGGTLEKDVNLAIARQVAAFLEQAGARVVLTRDRDVYVELGNRSRLANALGADAFISIHADAIGPGRTASGTGTFYHPGHGEAPDTGANARLAHAVHRELLSAIGLPDRGVRQRAFHVLIHTEMPAVLVEVAFIDNPAEERLLRDPEFQRRAAMGIAQGVVRYFAELRSEPLPRTVSDWDGELEQVAAAFLENGDLPADVLVVPPAAALGAAANSFAQTPEL